eukprot:872849-Prorocentrum_lima.AAC.1
MAVHPRWCFNGAEHTTQLLQPKHSLPACFVCGGCCFTAAVSSLLPTLHLREPRGSRTVGACL